MNVSLLLCEDTPVPELPPPRLWVKELSHLPPPGSSPTTEERAHMLLTLTGRPRGLDVPVIATSSEGVVLGWWSSMRTAAASLARIPGGAPARVVRISHACATGEPYEGVLWRRARHEDEGGVLSC
jgi:hypothetical protein